MPRELEGAELAAFRLQMAADCIGLVWDLALIARRAVVERRQAEGRVAVLERPRGWKPTPTDAWDRLD